MKNKFIAQQINSAVELDELALKAEREAIDKEKAEIFLTRKLADEKEEKLLFRENKLAKQVARAATRRYGIPLTVLVRKQTLEDANKRLKASDKKREVMKFAKNSGNEGTSAVELRTALPHIKASSIGNILRKLKEEGIIKQEGNTRYARYYYIEQE
jgi:hypothetical protein